MNCLAYLVMALSGTYLLGAYLLLIGKPKETTNAPVP